MKPTEPFIRFLVRLTIVLPDEADRRSPLYLLMARHLNDL